MAIQAIRNCLVLCRRVRSAVACFALRDNRMDYPVTKCTGEGLVFGGGLVHELADILVTRRAVSPRGLVWILNYQRRVDRMAYEAVLCCLALCVRLMTLGAFRNLSVKSMAKGAGKFCVLTRMFLKLYALFRMTGQAG